MDSGLSPSVVAAYATSFKDGYCNVAALALLLFEVCVTFDREVRHIWQRKASSATWIYILNRYSVIALYVVGATNTFPVSDESCPPLVRLSQILDIVPYLVWAAFSGLRAFAMSNRAWPIALIIMLLSLAPVAVYIFRDVQEYAMNYPAPMYCQTVASYSPSLQKPLTIVGRACLILSDCLVLGVTWNKTYGILRLSRKHGVDMSLSLTTVLLRDGSIYFIVWTILNSMHIVGTYAESLQYLTGFTEAATSILVSRFILNLREVAPGPRLPGADADADGDENRNWSFVDSWRVAARFRSVATVEVADFLAPLGAPLDHSLGSYGRASEFEEDLSPSGSEVEMKMDDSQIEAGGSHSTLAPGVGLASRMTNQHRGVPVNVDHRREERVPATVSGLSDHVAQLPKLVREI